MSRLGDVQSMKSSGHYSTTATQDKMVEIERKLQRMKSQGDVEKRVYRRVTVRIVSSVLNIVFLYWKRK